MKVLSDISGLVAEKYTDFLFRLDVPSLPNFQVNGLNIGETTLPQGPALSANGSIKLQNAFPVDLKIPPLSFSVLFPGCDRHDLVVVATAETSRLSVEPSTDIDLDISTIIPNLPASFIAPCPKCQISPVDNFLRSYLHGNYSNVYVRGSDTLSDAPQWILEFLRGITIPLSFPGHKFDTSINSINPSDIVVRFPDGDSLPGSPESAPRLSASVGLVVRLPEEITFPIAVKSLRSIAHVSYQGRIFATLNFHKWMRATSLLLDDRKQLQVNAVVDDAPLNVTDYGIFEEIVWKFVFGEQSVQLEITGTADVDVKTNVGEFIMSGITAAGTLTLDAFPAPGSLVLPTIDELVIADTTRQTITFLVKLSITNPTLWGFMVPYMNVNITHENMVLGNASFTDLHIIPGNNSIDVKVVWDPRAHGGDEAEAIGARLLSEYISGTIISH